MALERREQRVRGVEALHPHLAAFAVGGVAPGPAAGLHQQGEQALGRAEVAGEQGAVRVHRRHQGDVAEVVALGDHLGAYQHVHLAGMHLGQLGFQRALEAGAVGVDAHHLHGPAVGPPGAGQQLGQMLLQPLGAAPDGLDVHIAAGGAGAGHGLGEAAVVAAQAAVHLVEHAKGAAMRAFALPVAVAAAQHRGVAAAVQQHHALFATRHPLLDGGQQRRRENGAARLLVHVHPAHPGQAAGADAAGHLQAHVAAALLGGAAVVPALQGWGGGAQQHLGLLLPAPEDGQVAGGVAGALLLLVAGVVLFVHHHQPQARQRGEHRHAGAQHDTRRALVGGQPAAQALGRRHAAVHGHHGSRPVQRREAGVETGLQLGRQVDLGHHHQHLCIGVAFQQALGALQVDLGFAAAGGAEQQEGAVPGFDLRQHLLLLGA